MKLLSWGANTYSQLGHGIKSDQCILPLEIPAKDLPFDLSAVVSIVGGGGHTLVLNKHGQVYSCGWNSKGQLGLPMDSDILTFTKINLLEKYKIVKVSCGWDTSMAINQDGKLLTWGSNAYGQLGLPKDKVAFSSTPLEIQVPKIRAISVGLRHAAVITRNDRVLTCGDGRKGQLGLIDENGTPIKQTDVPTEVTGITDVQDVACGQHHTVVLTKTGQVFAWGDNKHGQLGLDPTICPNVTIPLEVLTVKPVSLLPKCTISCGWTHTNLLTGKETLMNWGRNTYGQLGSHEFQRPVNWKPQVLECVSSVKQLAVGSEHNIVIAGNGQLLSWGWNEHGNCGIGTEEDVHTPTPVVNYHHSISLIGSGAGHCFALADS